MINEDPNMGRKQIFSELPLPSKVEEKGILTLIYKGVFIIIKLLLDIRLNLVKISEGKPIKTKHKEFQGRSHKPASEKSVDNPIKGLDNIKIEDKLVVKVDDSTIEKSSELVTKKEDTKPTPETNSDEKSDEATNDTNKPSEEK